MELGVPDRGRHDLGAVELVGVQELVPHVVRELLEHRRNSSESTGIVKLNVTWPTTAGTFGEYASGFERGAERTLHQLCQPLRPLGLGYYPRRLVAGALPDLLLRAAVGQAGPGRGGFCDADVGG